MEEGKDFNKCDSCEKVISKKPWMTVLNKGIHKNVCCYTCANNYTKNYGGGYWKEIVNKEDFNGLRPVFEVHNINSQMLDITDEFDIEEIKIELEHETINSSGSDYDSDYDCDYDYETTTDEDHHEENY
jgi:hypothetical protein